MAPACADDFVAKLAKKAADELATKLAPPLEGYQPPSEMQVSAKSISLQSFTMTEFFYRCSVEFPQVEIGGKKEKTTSRLWYGQAFNLDECYEFLDNIGLLGSRHDRDKTSGAQNIHLLRELTGSAHCLVTPWQWPSSKAHQHGAGPGRWTHCSYKGKVSLCCGCVCGKAR